MNIKDPQVHAMARELASRRGTTVTDAVLQALAAELQRTPDHQSADARLLALAELQERCRKLPRRDSRDLREIENELYDENGLPW